MRPWKVDMVEIVDMERCEVMALEDCTFKRIADNYRFAELERV